MSVGKLFILGNPRSGTSLFRLMMNSHRRVGAPPECGFLHWWYGKYGGWSVADGRNPEKVDKFIADLLTSKKIESWELVASELRRYLLNIQPANYGALTAACYQHWAERGGKKLDWIADKNNYYIKHLDVISDVWPNAKYILIVRDGRDVACSYLEVNRLDTASPYKPVLPTAIDDIAKEWEMNNRRVLDFFDAMRASDTMVLRFEDIIQNTEAALNGVCQFLGIEFDYRMLKYYEEEDVNQKEPAITLDWKRKTMEKPDVSNIGKYKVYLTHEQVRIFNSISGEMLNQFGYVVY